MVSVLGFDLMWKRLVGGLLGREEVWVGFGKDDDDIVDFEVWVKRLWEIFEHDGVFCIETFLWGL